MTRALVARAPTRLDFGGGWTDVPPYCEREGGAVCNIAIARYATASLSMGAVSGEPVSAPDDALIAAAIRRAGVAAAHATLRSDYPIGAGLGGSSAAGVALAGALAHLAGSPLEPHALALKSRATEVEELGVAGGFQDHFAAAFGGALLLEFGQEARVERIPISDSLRADIVRRGLLVYTGESRISAEQITAVRVAYMNAEPRVVNALARMKALAYEMAQSLRDGDVDALGALLSEHWAHQRALHPSISTARIDAIDAASRSAGALGMKALGASGGGCVFVVAANGREEELVRALAPLGTRLDFDLDVTGFDIVATMDDHAESWST